MTGSEPARPGVESAGKHRLLHAWFERARVHWPWRALWLSLMLSMALAIGYFYLRDNAPARQPIRFDLGRDIHASRESGLRQEGLDSRPDRKAQYIYYESGDIPHAALVEYTRPGYQLALPHVHRLTLSANVKWYPDNRVYQAELELQSSLLPSPFYSHGQAQALVQDIIGQFRQGKWQRYLDPGDPRVTGRSSILDEFGQVDSNPASIDPAYTLLPEEWATLQTKRWYWIGDGVLATLDVSSFERNRDAVYPSYSIELDFEDLATHQAFWSARETESLREADAKGWKGTERAIREQTEREALNKRLRAHALARGDRVIDAPTPSPPAILAQHDLLDGSSLTVSEWYTPMLLGLQKAEHVLWQGVRFTLFMLEDSSFLTFFVFPIWAYFLLFKRQARKNFRRRPILNSLLFSLSALCFLLFLRLVLMSYHFWVLREQEEHSWRPTLNQPAQLAGIDMPAGTALSLLAKDKPDSFRDARFPQPVLVHGIPVKRLRRDVDPSEQAARQVVRLFLNADSDVHAGPWICRAPDTSRYVDELPDQNSIILVPAGEGARAVFRQCMLGAGNKADGIALPAGSFVQAGNQALDANGRPRSNLWRIELAAGQSLMIRGWLVAGGTLYLDEHLDVVRVENLALTRPFTLGAMTYPAGTTVSHAYGPGATTGSRPGALLFRLPRAGAQSAGLGPGAWVIQAEDGAVLEQGSVVAAR